MQGNLQLGRSSANSRCITRQSQSISLRVELAMLFYNCGAANFRSKSANRCDGWNGITFVRKKKIGIKIEKEARRRARAGIGMPPTQRLIPDKRRKAPKRKKSLQDSSRG
jgi:hypothetical protein